MVLDGFSLAARAALIAGMLSLVLAGCGRRGPLEAPPDASAPQGQAQAKKAVAQDEEEGDEDDKSAVAAAPSPAPQKRSRAYVIPKEPFILDPLL